MTLQALEAKADRALEAIATELEAMLAKAVRQAAKRNPGKLVIGCSAMGGWHLDVNDDDRNPAVIASFDRMFKYYGIGAIPTVRICARDEREQIDHDWGGTGVPQLL